LEQGRKYPKTSQHPAQGSARDEALVLSLCCPLLRVSTSRRARPNDQTQQRG
jgi:hypothetical protein